MVSKHKPITILVTGATSGIGKSTAKVLSDDGCKVFVHGRNEKKAQDACAELGQKSTIPVWGDLSDLKQVRLLSKQIAETAAVFDVVIFNAGVFQKGGLISADGFELDFAVNYLSHLLLAHLFLSQSCLSPQARIIFVSSSAYINGKVDVNNLGKEHLQDPMMAYATSKQLCLMSALELSVRLSKTSMCVNACNPGPTDTALLAEGKNFGWNNSGSSVVKAAHRIKWLASSPELKKTSGYYFNGRKTPNVPKRIRDENITAIIYETSMRLCNANKLLIKKLPDLHIAQTWQ